MKKAQDSNYAKMAGTIQTALNAYYTGTEKYPWTTTPTVSAVAFHTFSSGALSSGISSVTDSLSADLKAALFQQVDEAQVFVGNSVSEESAVCYVPSSSAARQSLRTSLSYQDFVWKRFTVPANSVTTLATELAALPVDGTAYTVCTGTGYGWTYTAGAALNMCALCTSDF